MVLYFECKISKNALLQTLFFGDFAHWETLDKYGMKYRILGSD